MYNVERFLRRCLDSVKNQTFQDWTAICVDDGSPDKSGSIAEEYAKNDKRFVVIHKKNGGLSDARNTGMKKAKSEYVMFLDSDDFIHPQTMEIVYGLAQKNNVDMVSFLKNNISSNTKIDKHNKITKFDFIVTDNVLKYAAERDGIRSKYAIKRAYVWQKLYKTDLIKNIKFPVDIKLCEDFYWLSEVYSKLPKTLIANVGLYYYVQNESSLLHTSKKMDFIKYVWLGLKHNFDIYKKMDKKYFKLYSENFIWPFIYSMVRTIKSLDDENDKKTAVGYIKDIYEKGMCSKPYDLQSLKYYFRIKKLLKSYS